MDLRELLLVFTMLWKMSSGLQCYQCQPQFETHIQEHLCEHFDYSDKYLVECNDSTMCYKRVIWSHLDNGVKYFGRGCAMQTMNNYQERTSKGWIPVRKIFEKYEEGCTETSNNEFKVTKTIECYCRGHLCNGTGKVKSGSAILLLTALIVLGY